MFGNVFVMKIEKRLRDGGLLLLKNHSGQGLVRTSGNVLVSHGSKSFVIHARVSLMVFSSLESGASAPDAAAANHTVTAITKHRITKEDSRGAAWRGFI